MLLIEACVQWCSWSPTPQFVLSTIRTSCDCQTRSSRVDSPALRVERAGHQARLRGPVDVDHHQAALPRVGMAAVGPAADVRVVLMDRDRRVHAAVLERLVADLPELAARSVRGGARGLSGGFGRAPRGGGAVAAVPVREAVGGRRLGQRRAAVRRMAAGRRRQQRDRHERGRSDAEVAYASMGHGTFSPVEAAPSRGAPPYASPYPVGAGASPPVGPPARRAP